MNAVLVLDCSVTVAALFEDECDPYADACFAEAARCGALVPSIWTLEVANALVTAERRKRLTHAASREAMALLLQLPLTVIDTATLVQMERLHAIAGTHGLSVYDAAYLQVAMNSGIPLATNDDALKKAMRKAGGRLFQR